MFFIKDQVFFLIGSYLPQHHGFSHIVKNLGT